MEDQDSRYYWMLAWLLDHHQAGTFSISLIQRKLGFGFALAEKAFNQLLAGGALTKNKDNPAYTVVDREQYFRAVAQFVRERHQDSPLQNSTDIIEIICSEHSQKFSSCHQFHYSLNQIPLTIVENLAPDKLRNLPYDSLCEYLKWCPDAVQKTILTKYVKRGDVNESLLSYLEQFFPGELALTTPVMIDFVTECRLSGAHVLTVTGTANDFVKKYQTQKDIGATLGLIELGANVKFGEVAEMLTLLSTAKKQYRVLVNSKIKNIKVTLIYAERWFH